nr:Chain B, Nuclear receptor coactivator 2 [Homo sapiens]3OZJ_B Chain B, SRC-1, peptide of Nuclear receptor coactivator 2 [Homo sapiens]3OZJ_D Chain D, SRC-1, peptide of Nuclear receptor coactivator 2 [Homo sapiens]4M8E_B Chain B, Nuclear receptor coactivator 2 [Homo sapiens]4M8H_B Chain B, Nuclear receptor coactivator 2 [Homo sapiens]5EC9_B Chain B, LYS-HIS-LYS-ILE-LEU-HIS-ARG-LEU-LEU-GLN-ASP [Homo sapiens]5MK4_B Chain B, Nuclear receptor coactivator 2 [Homo sapiens]5MK4_D Chain D, Nuclear 
KHKILHRLLQD